MAKGKTGVGIQLEVPPTLPPQLMAAIDEMMSGGAKATNEFARRAQVEILCHMAIDFACRHLENEFADAMGQRGAVGKLRKNLRDDEPFILSVVRVRAGDALEAQLAKVSGPKGEPS